VGSGEALGVGVGDLGGVVGDGEGEGVGVGEGEGFEEGVGVGDVVMSGADKGLISGVGVGFCVGNGTGCTAVLPMENEIRKNEAKSVAAARRTATSLKCNRNSLASTTYHIPSKDKTVLVKKY
jgi:hypothetical protein